MSWIRLCMCVVGCFVGLGLTTPKAYAAGKVGVYVQNVQASDQTAALWLGGVWSAKFQNEQQTTEDVLGGVTSDKQTSLSDGKKFFDEGKTAFDNLSPEKAFRSFRRGIRALEEALPYTQDFDLLAKMWLYIGVSYLLNGKKDKGQEAFRTALLLRPNINLTGVSDDQNKIQLFEQVKGELQGTKKGTLQVNASPAGVVFVNGRLIGVTPAKVEVYPGTHIVVVRRPGYGWWGKQVAVSANGFSVTATLQKRTGTDNWINTGNAAVVHTLRRSDVPGEVKAYGTLMKTDVVVLARVRQVQGGSFLSVQTAVYDLDKGKQRAAGGALIPWGPSTASQEMALQLLNSLLGGQATALNGWTPSSIGIPEPGTPGKGGNTGLYIGLGVVGGLVVVGGVTVLILYLTNPRLFTSCPGDVGCVKLVIRK